MEKTINFDGYNVAAIKKRYANGDCLCDIRQEVVSEATETTEASVQVVKQDKDIVFVADKLPFELTAEDIDILNPKPTKNEQVLH